MYNLKRLDHYRIFRPYNAYHKTREKTPDIHLVVIQDPLGLFANQNEYGTWCHYPIAKLICTCCYINNSMLNLVSKCVGIFMVDYHFSTLQYPSLHLGETCKLGEHFQRRGPYSGRPSIMDLVLNYFTMQFLEFVAFLHHQHDFRDKGQRLVLCICWRCKLRTSKLC